VPLSQRLKKSQMRPQVRLSCATVFGRGAPDSSYRNAYAALLLPLMSQITSASLIP
jgi:hypothetical protein